jgi:hypothetical protein
MLLPLFLPAAVLQLVSLNHESDCARDNMHALRLLSLLQDHLLSGSAKVIKATQASSS